MRLFAFACLATAAASPALADITLRFDEGAPKDRFVLSSTDSDCAVGPMQIDIDLEGSAGKLVFDVTGAGAGVEVFQPFDLVSGRDLVEALPDVRDGDTGLTLALSSLPPGVDVAFTIDVDDTIAAREITVTDAEIAGASFTAFLDGQERRGVFGADATASISMTDCRS